MRKLLASKAWQRNKFHLSALMMLVPLPFLPGYFSAKPIFAPPEIHRAVSVGPFPITLVTFDQAPHRGPAGDLVKDYSIRLQPADLDRVRGVFLRVGKPRNLRAAGALGFGNPYEREAEVAMPANPTGTEELWLTVEDWTGTVHQTSLPLAEVLGGKR
ncbi:hypothetical protein [Azospirillum doebereinerae]|uniref:Uncharacterized protein n=1 Tax=Azospirillum doebereinerae TaxID=92933 RepID=A0A433J7G6_9PROT|nr:hypothetical protein [Azospirillum doebereinerae]MCG5241847.1 hypothetical protein [Azospirillum doebereinerae]RUQ69369.1 hypothetical protein EJ913_16525 [Azospirillum doebereinerae]